MRAYLWFCVGVWLLTAWPWTIWLLFLGAGCRRTCEALYDVFHRDADVFREIAGSDIEDGQSSRRWLAERDGPISPGRT